MPKQLILAAAILYTLAIIFVSLVNIGEMPDLGTSYNDKILHFVAYLGLGFIWIYYLVPVKSRRKIAFVILLLFLFGIALEGVQHLINPARTYDTIDMLANCLGISIGTAIAVMYNVFKLNKYKRLRS